VKVKLICCIGMFNELSMSKVKVIQPDSTRFELNWIVQGKCGPLNKLSKVKVIQSKSKGFNSS